MECKYVIGEMKLRILRGRLHKKLWRVQILSEELSGVDMGRAERAMVDHEVASKVCGVSRKKIGLERTKWWNDDVQKVV